MFKCFCINVWPQVTELSALNVQYMFKDFLNLFKPRTSWFWSHTLCLLLGQTNRITRWLLVHHITPHITDVLDRLNKMLLLFPHRMSIGTKFLLWIMLEWKVITIKMVYPLRSMNALCKHYANLPDVFIIKSTFWLNSDIGTYYVLDIAEDLKGSSLKQHEFLTAFLITDLFAVKPCCTLLFRSLVSLWNFLLCNENTSFHLC